MDSIRRFAKPVLRRPRAVLAFEGWNDACDAASGAATYLLSHYDATEPFAVIESEDYFDFQANRPQVTVTDGGTRSLTWPTTRFFAVEVPESSRDLIVVLGDEPNLRWKTFTRETARLLCDMDVEEVVIMGAFIGQVAHTRPVPLMGVATDEAALERAGVHASDYEGPTGIVGVLMEACRETGIPALSLWAAAPHYLAANPNPKAMLALVRKTAEVLSLDVDTAELETVTEEFLQRVDEAMEASGSFAEYVASLEEQSAGPVASVEADPVAGGQLVSEIEQFLKEQN